MNDKEFYIVAVAVGAIAYLLIKKAGASESQSAVANTSFKGGGSPSLENVQPNDMSIWQFEPSFLGGGSPSVQNVSGGGFQGGGSPSVENVSQVNTSGAAVDSSGDWMVKDPFAWN